MKNAALWDRRIQFVPHRKHIASQPQNPAGQCYVRLEILTAETMKNVVIWDVTLCGSFEKAASEERIASIITVTGICELEKRQ
jgi:hypothetical protein